MNKTLIKLMLRVVWLMKGCKFTDPGDEYELKAITTELEAMLGGDNEGNNESNSCMGSGNHSCCAGGNDNCKCG